MALSVVKPSHREARCAPLAWLADSCFVVFTVLHKKKAFHFRLRTNLLRFLVRDVTWGLPSSNFEKARNVTSKGRKGSRQTNPVALLLPTTLTSISQDETGSKEPQLLASSIHTSNAKIHK
jgi:hypothetical protein